MPVQQESSDTVTRDTFRYPNSLQGAAKKTQTRQGGAGKDSICTLQPTNYATNKSKISKATRSWQ